RDYKDRVAGGRRPLGRAGIMVESGIMVVRAERRPRRLGDARREASLGSWSCEPSGGRGGSATRAARRVWDHGIVMPRCTHAGTMPRPAGSRVSIFSSTLPV